MSLAHNIFNAFKEIVIYSKEVFLKNIYSDLSKKLFITDQNLIFSKLMLNLAWNCYLRIIVYILNVSF